MEERRSSQMSALTNQQREIAQIQSFIERFRYKATKAKQVQSRIKMLEKMDKVSIDEVSTESIHFQFPPAPHSGKVVVEAEHLYKAYGDKVILNDLNFIIPKGSKTAFVGKNGEGKSTLAKIIIGEINDYSGVFKLGHQVSIGYFAQNQAALLDGEKTVFDTIDQIAVGDIRPKIRNILGSFLFDEDDIEKKVKVLSGGEKARLALAKLLLTPCNLLVLDEPTNHLDMNSKDILKNALLQYTGTLIVVSHDRDFLQGLTDTLYEFKNHTIKEFKGDIFEFLEYRKIEDLQALEIEKKAVAEKSAPTVSQNKLNYEQSKQRERDLRKLRSTVEKIEKEIETTENEIAQKDEILASDPQSIANDPNFYTTYEDLKNRLEKLMEDWEAATEAVENF
jgi:ATP-binding cassette subfamily F protein 3